MKEIDTRGLACPAPLVQTKAAIQGKGLNRVRVVVDNIAAQHNVQRFLASQGFETTLERDGSDYAIVGSCHSATSEQSQATASSVRDVKKVLVMCATDRMGYGDDALGMKLMVTFIYTLREMGEELWRLILVNNGVKLTIDGSEVLQGLKAQEEKGLKILVCGTCLAHFDLLERNQVGETTNMLDIITAMQLADKVISL